MTPEAEREYLLLKVKVARAREAEAAAAPNPPPVASMSAANKARGLLQTVQQGQLAGFGDEVVGAGRAALDPATYGIDARPWGEQYALYRDDERANRAKFNDEYDKTALALNVGGSFISPLNYVLPGVGAGGSTSAAAAAIARGGVEGAIQGFGEGEGTLDEQLASAQKGAQWGAGTTAGLRAAGKALGKTLASKRKGFEEMIQPNGRVKPITLAGSPRWSEFYRDVIGGGSGGGRQLSDQEAPFLAEAADELEAVQKTARDAAAQRSIDLANETGRQNAMVDVQMRHNVAQDTLPVPPTVAGQKVDPRALPETMEANRVVALSATPEHALNSVDVNASPKQTWGALKKWWKNNAFNEVKSRDFTLSDDLRSQLTALAPDAKLELGAVVDKAARKQATAQGVNLYDVEDVVDEAGNVTGRVRRNWNPEKVLDWALNNKDINGDVLMALRNSFAIAANAKTGMPSGAQRKVANIFDAEIRNGLKDDPQALAQFDDQINKYTTWLTLDKAQKRNAVVKAGGVATPEELLNSGSKYLKLDADGVPRRPLETTLINLNNKVKAVEGTPTNSVAADAAKTNNAQVLATARQQAAAQKQGIRGGTRLKKAALAEQKIAAQNSGPVLGAKLKMDELASRATSPSRSMLSRRLMDQVLGGAVVPGTSSIPARMAGGILAAAGLAKPGAQLAIAGQAPIQRELRRALSEGDYAAYNRILSRIAAGQATGE